MDNDGKVKDLVSKSKNAFLDWKNLEVGARELYDLEVEFAASKKNRNYVVMITLLVFLIAVVGTAYAVTRYIQESGKVVPVQIKDFEDVNLKDILDVAKKYEQNLRKTKADQENLRLNMNEEIDNLNSKAERDVSIVMASGESDNMKKLRVAAIYKKRNSDSAIIKSEYGEKIAVKEEEIKEIEKSMASYDAAVLDKARKQDEILNNQRRMAELQQQELINSYEERIRSITANYEAENASLKRDSARLASVLKNKLDPVFKSENIKKILSDKKAKTVPALADQTSVSILEKDNAASAGEIDSIRQESEKINILLDQLAKVPYQNSVADAVKRLNEKELFIRNGYESVWNKSAQKLDEKNRHIENFSNAFDYYIQASGVSGYVVDPVSSDEIIVFMNKILEIKTGDKAYVFRNDNEPIGEIEFYYTDDKLFARETGSPQQGAEKKQIRPFDRILVIIR